MKENQNKIGDGNPILGQGGVGVELKGVSDRKSYDVALMEGIHCRIADGQSLTNEDYRFISGIDGVIKALTFEYVNFQRDYSVRRAVKKYSDSIFGLQETTEVKQNGVLSREIDDVESIEQVKGKIKNGQSLTREDIRFVYEIDGIIEGLTSDEYVDFRRDCLCGRDIKKDLLVAFDCLFEQIVDREEDITENTVAVLGNLTEKSSGLINSRKNFLFVYGQANLNGSDDLTLIPECMFFHEPSGFWNCSSLISVAGNFIGGVDFRYCSSLSSVSGVFGRRSVFWDCPNLTSISAEFNGNTSFVKCNSLNSISEMTVSGEASFTDSELSKKIMKQLQGKWHDGEINELFF
jgi:hypothetical protein